MEKKLIRKIVNAILVVMGLYILIKINVYQMIATAFCCCQCLSKKTSPNILTNKFLIKIFNFII